jgi:chromosome segregation ATPase
MAENQGITGLDAEIEALQSKLSKAESELSETKGELAEAEADLADAEAALMAAQAELALEKERARQSGAGSMKLKAQISGFASAVCLRMI